MDPFSPTGMGGLQSGFVLAAIVLAVFFAERLGGSGQLAERGFQLVLAFGITFVVISGTTAFHRADDVAGISGTLFEEEPFQSAEDFEAIRDAGAATARNASEVRTIHAGLGLLLVLAGVAAFRRWPVVSVAPLIGGLLLLLFGSPSQQGGASGPLDLFTSLFGALLPGGAAGAGQARDIAHFAVLLFGTAALAVLGYWRWERTGPAGLTAR